MIRLFALFLGLSLGLGFAQDATAPASTTPRLRLGTWNLENFGKRNPARTPEAIQAIATKIKELGVDVLALQEINGKASLSKLVAALGSDYEFVIGSTGKFGGSAQIGVGFIWNTTRVELLHAEELFQLPSEIDEMSIFHRVPILGAFRSKQGGLDFRAVNVHLKASKKPRDIAKRVREVTALKGLLTRWLSGEVDQDMVILGDFNHTYDAPANKILNEGFEYLKPASLSPTIIHFPEPIDHFAVGPGLMPEVLKSTLKVHGDMAAEDRDSWRMIYSDHIPVTVDLTDVDNDPNARIPSPTKRHLLGPGGFQAMAGKERPKTAPKKQIALRPGSAVTVILDGASIVEGTLAAPLESEWVQLRLKDGKIVALPSRRISEIRGR